MSPKEQGSPEMEYLQYLSEHPELQQSRPQEFIIEAREAWENQSVVKILKKASDFNKSQYAITIRLYDEFLRSQLSHLLEELEKEMPEEEKIQKYTQAEVSYVEGFNSCRSSILSTLKDWEEGIKN